MAKRKRLIPPSGGETGSDIAENGLSGPLEVKAFLRPGLGGGLGNDGPPIARVVAESSAEAALAEVTQAMTEARAAGRLVQVLPLEAIDPGHLVRDRIALDEEELSHLIASIRDHGQRMPIEVADLGAGRYGLISGWRRLQALRRLAEEAGEGMDGAKYGTVLALLRRPKDAPEAYVAMVEENEVRQGLSYYERARIAARAVDLGVFGTEKQALQQLFSAASRARRSKIGSFLTIVRALDEALRFPAAIPERLGLALAKALETRPEEGRALADALKSDPAPDTAAELARLGAFSTLKNGSDKAEKTLVARDDAPAVASGQEIRPGVFLRLEGGFTKPVLILSGPAVGPGFRERLEDWLKSGK
ncbi:ParB/RepB/Spo0J family partition protein [Szabonella alba]|uniref:ParB N-terminal domain-containing protein n=1 Tax=Szabonella alba TaxID=2804194 RepID=A0A8K0Y1I6_9RHOB|nr:ParB N-terminal domain-containing protein [Szabonella alba]MBL4919350.1 ParB N-terminal domain-containing protein [Szabonella alba]